MKSDAAHMLAWPASRLGEALEAIARKSGLSPHQVDTPNPPGSIFTGEDQALGQWVETAAASFGLEAEPVETLYAEAERFVRDAGPALIRLPGAGEPSFLALLESRGRHVRVLAPDLSIRKLRPEIISNALTSALEAPLTAGVPRLLAKAGAGRRRFAPARAVML